MKKNYKVISTICALIATFGIFVVYILKNPASMESIRHTKLQTILMVFALYLCVTLSLALVLIASTAICGKKMSLKSSFTLTQLSSVLNFVGPFQGGIGLRAVYLKRKFGITIKQYTVVTLYYFGLYAVFSALFVLIGAPKLRLPLLGFVSLCVLASALVLKLQKTRTKESLIVPRAKHVALLCAAVLLQLFFTALIYHIELNSNTRSPVSFLQSMSYTGAANFSLFVALTPGAIGIREFFLVFSQKIHGIATAHIVSANVLDRGIYILFLAGSSLFLWATHAGQKFSAYATTKTVRKKQLHNKDESSAPH